MNLTPPYVAGFFDGEGCVNMARNRSVRYPRVLITSTNREILEIIKDQYGGDISPVVHRHDNWKPSWMWRLSWNPAVEFLRDILPWLIVKKDHARTAIAWADNSPGKGGKWHQASLDFLCERMAWLNRKGPNLEEDPADVVARGAA